MKDIKNIKEYENKTIDYIFLCSTPYHLLVSYIYIFGHHINSKALVYSKDLSHCLIDTANLAKKSGVCTLNVEVKKSKLKKFSDNIFDKRLYNTLTKNKAKNSKVHLINFCWNLDHIYYRVNELYKLCDDAIFIEEGAGCFCNFTGSKFYKFIKRLSGVRFDFYKDKKLQKIYVTMPERYPDKFKEKIELFSLNDEWRKLISEQQDTIISFFISKEVKDNICNLNNVGIIYTQPLSEDGFITEQEKISYYKQIYEFYSQYGRPVIKLHPRDTTDYGIQNAMVLAANFPSELFGLMNIHFLYAIGICTSAIYTTDADWKINLNENFLKEQKFNLISLDSNAASRE